MKVGGEIDVLFPGHWARGIDWPMYLVIALMIVICVLIREKR